MNNISGYGLKIQVLASVTFPLGFTLSQFAADTDPFDIPSLQIANKSMGLNGDLIIASAANPLVVTLAVIPTSNDDRNLSILFEANRVSRGKRSARDVITLIGMYPNGSIVTFKEGSITDGVPANGVASAGAIKTKTYSFAFEGTDQLLV